MYGVCLRLLCCSCRLGITECVKKIRELHGSAVCLWSKISISTGIREIHGSTVCSWATIVHRRSGEFHWSAVHLLAKTVHWDQLLADNGTKRGHISVLLVC